MRDIEPLHLRFDTFELDESEARLLQAGRPVALPPKAFAVLCALARRPGQLVAKDALLDAVWGHRHITESVLKTTISELRAALADDAKQPRFIETASRRGYRFIGTVSWIATTEAPAVQSIAVRSIDAHAGTLIGRGAALARLHSAWEQACTGRRQLVWVAGEAGVGKTSLIDCFVSQLDPVACARGQCVEQYGTGEPYLPVLEALAALCRAHPALAGMLRSVAPTWLLQLPWLSSDAEREALRRELAGTGQDRMLRELGELLDRYTENRPLLLVTEDLHWSDHATVHLLDHLARRRSNARLMWLASFRLTEVVSEDHPLKALRHELRLHRLCDEVVLDPFSEQEVAELITARLPVADVSEAFVRRLHGHTDGLPLFVVNVLDDLFAQGAFENGAGAEGSALHVPENLMGVIEQQIGRLPAELQRVLEAASVCGVEFRPDTVADALERDPVWVGERCDELVRRQR
jgi:DNA-binding winged helix-turn-helix (wHTH) protein